MDTKTNYKAILPRNQQQLSPLDERVISKTLEFATKEEKEKDKTSATVDQWGFFRSFWDSKVPEKDKWFFFSISIWLSDKKKVVEKIKKYKEFYKEFGDITKTVKEKLESEDERNVNLHTMILEMNKKLLEMQKTAEAGVKDTDSSTMYEMHKEFIRKHEEIENLIQGVQCIALKEDLNNAISFCKEANERAERKEAEYEKREKNYQERCKVTSDKLAKHEENNRNMKHEVNKMAEAFAEMKERHDVLLAENMNKEAVCNLIMEDLTATTADFKASMEANKLLKADMEAVKADCMEIKQALVTMMRNEEKNREEREKNREERDALLKEIMRLKKSNNSHESSRQSKGESDESE